MDQEENTQKENTLRSLIPKLSVMYYELFELLAVIVLAILAVITVSEMASRESFSNSVSSKISSLNADLANIAINMTTNNDQKISPSIYMSKDNATAKIGDFEELNDKVTTLINVGVSDQSDILKALIKLFQKAAARSIDDNNDKNQDQNDKDTNNPPPTNSFLGSLSNSDLIGFIYEMRSDHLLALSIICSSALGAMIFGLRSGARMSVRTLTSGLATGFIVYLALKGGQHLFLLTSSDVRIPSNPYSSAFAGLLAGLFSDKAYKVLTSLVNDVATRVENSTNRNESKE